MITVVNCMETNKCVSIEEPNPLSSTLQDIEAYESWLKKAISAGDKRVIGELSRLKAMALMGDVAIGCVNPAHGMIVKKYVELSVAQLKRRQVANQFAFNLLGTFSCRVLDKRGNYHYYTPSDKMKPKANFLIEECTLAKDVEGHSVFVGDYIKMLEPDRNYEAVIYEVVKTGDGYVLMNDTDTKKLPNFVLGVVQELSKAQQAYFKEDALLATC